MTDAPNPCNSTGIREETARELLAVTQADRDAAADFAGNYVPFTKEGMAALRSGTHDSHLFVQAFARHRLAALTHPISREAVARALYDSSPHTVISAALAEKTGLPLGETLTWDVAVAAGADMSALFRYADAAIATLSPSPCDCLGEWVALTAERVLYVDKGKETILCDRLPSPITLVLKNPAHADGAYLPSADTGEFRIPLADRKGVSAAPCCLGVVEALKALMFEVRCNREPLSRPVHKALMRADAALQGPGGEE